MQKLVKNKREKTNKKDFFNITNFPRKFEEVVEVQLKNPKLKRIIRVNILSITTRIKRFSYKY